MEIPDRLFALMADITLEELLKGFEARKAPPRRGAAEDVIDIEEIFGLNRVMRRQEIVSSIQGCGFSRTSADRLLRKAVDDGVLLKPRHGWYMRRPSEPDRKRQGKLLKQLEWWLGYPHPQLKLWAKIKSNG